MMNLNESLWHAKCEVVCEKHLSLIEKQFCFDKKEICFLLIANEWT